MGAKLVVKSHKKYKKLSPLKKISNDPCADLPLRVTEDVDQYKDHTNSLSYFYDPANNAPYPT